MGVKVFSQYVVNTPMLAGLAVLGTAAGRRKAKQTPQTRTRPAASGLFVSAKKNRKKRKTP
jgi:hypothetical protein